MSTAVKVPKMQTDILAFLGSIKNEINSVEELIEGLRAENKRAELYGQQHIEELLEISAYQWQLEQIEMKLKAPSLIQIRFCNNGFEPRVLSGEEQVEAEVLSMIIRLVRETKL